MVRCGAVRRDEGPHAHPDWGRSAARRVLPLRCGAVRLGSSGVRHHRGPAVMASLSLVSVDTSVMGAHNCGAALAVSQAFFGNKHTPIPGGREDKKEE